MTVNVNGTEIHLKFSFVFVLTLMLLFCQQDIIIVCVLSSMLHEGGHIVFMKLFGEGILSATFGAFGVRIERRNKCSLSYIKEGVIALGGIIINILLAFLGVIYYYLMKNQQALMFSIINLLIALFNCIPINLLDMGRALRCFLLMRYDEDKTDRALNIISLVFVNITAFVCVIYSAFVNINPSFIAVTVYLYIITLFKKWS